MSYFELCFFKVTKKAYYVILHNIYSVYYEEQIFFLDLIYQRLPLENMTFHVLFLTFIYFKMTDIIQMNKYLIFFNAFIVYSKQLQTHHLEYETTGFYLLRDFVFLVTIIWLLRSTKIRQMLEHKYFVLYS